MTDVRLMVLALLLISVRSEICPLTKSNHECMDIESYICTEQNRTNVPQITNKDTACLDFSSNQLRQLQHDEFKDLPNLKHVYVRNNQLEELSYDLFIYNRALITVSFQGNRLASIPPNLFKKNRILQYVNFSHNKLTSVPYILFDSQDYLESIYFSGNKVTKISFQMIVTSTLHQYLHCIPCHDCTCLDGHLNKQIGDSVLTSSITTALQTIEVNDYGCYGFFNHLNTVSCLLEAGHIIINCTGEKGLIYNHFAEDGLQCLCSYKESTTEDCSVKISDLDYSPAKPIIFLVTISKYITNINTDSRGETVNISTGSHGETILINSFNIYDDAISTNSFNIYDDAISTNSSNIHYYNEQGVKPNIIGIILTILSAVLGTIFGGTTIVTVIQHFKKRVQVVIKLYQEELQDDKTCEIVDQEIESLSILNGMDALHFMNSRLGANIPPYDHSILHEVDWI